jgi:hypothetical protein
MFVHDERKASRKDPATTPPQRRVNAIFALEKPDYMPDARK